MADDPCIGMAIWQDALRQHPELRTAQQRYALDQYLRKRLRRIQDDGLRQHAAAIIREQRGAALGWRRLPETEVRLKSIEQRLTNIEAALGLREARGEIRSLDRTARRKGGNG